MTNTRKYFFKRAILVTLLAIFFLLWLLSKVTLKQDLSPVFFILIIVLFIYQQKRLDKGGSTNIFKIARDGFPQGLKHDDEREAKNALTASFFSQRFTAGFIVLVIGISLILTSYKLIEESVFNINAFGILGTAILIVQEWSFYYEYSRLDK
ncbi:hypothetical protein [Companilactobacillus kimchii]|uniref:Integral membrane protein n=2 Tax=Companilactobacillus kimchii TaxID=2801452 RepID=A0ABR5NVD6_9LACO|nr:hypothetical protein [Companilactobacillus kimchii]KAE9558156.1 hypothetical protein ATN91_15355 [Companilactobacillus kimchii]KRK52809.1 hypothetical protein FC97_GL001976 [Companilactobacillus kimchii DSM 13961 = JCM 10707]OWF32936.1 hypothetical protein LKACC12383_01426 [Companilactobacillus kimchii]GEO46895.1 hypothetical protein LKI01_08940 [Companilactobacillus paralimentarius]